MMGKSPHCMHQCQSVITACYIQTTLSPVCRHLLGSTLEEVADSVFHQRPVNSPAMLVTLTNALLRPCAIALIKVALLILLLGLGMHLSLHDIELCTTD